ncbi:MAG: hypothetical protein WC565_07805 [Parcubacteria group bacterium]|jgi:BMFP domain-containing protein YqiC|nr:hypothetical protein [Candidatus Krumholzibacteria bacterium]
MDNEKEILDEENAAADEQEDESQDDPIDDGDEQEDESTGEEEEDGTESYDSEEDYLKQFDLPGSPKSLDEALASAKEAVRRMNELQREVAQLRSGVRQENQPADNRGNQTQQNMPEQYYHKNPITEYLKRMEESGRVDPEQAKAVRSWGSTIDEALSANWQRNLEAQAMLARELERTQKALRDMSWASFKHTDLVKREELDNIMQANQLLDYNQALQYKLSVDTGLLEKYADRQRKLGAREAEKRNKRNFKRFSGPRGGAPQAKKSPVYEKFLDKTGNLDRARLNKIPSDKARKIAEAFGKDHGIL